MCDFRSSEQNNAPSIPGTNDPENYEQKRRKELYDSLAAQARTDQQASSDAFDKSLLTFSSGALGLSLAFIKDVVPLDKAGWLPWLYLSWIAFASCIGVTIASFQLGIQAQKTHLDYLYEYYIECKDEFFNKKNCWTKAVTSCAVAGATFFLAGLIGTMIFVLENISRGIHK
jgi:hypothetical protein